MALDKYDLLHEDDKWKLRERGADRAIKTFEKKDEALGFSTGYVREHEGSLVIRKMNDRIQEERTYPRSKDPRRSAG